MKLRDKIRWYLLVLLALGCGESGPQSRATGVSGPTGSGGEVASGGSVASGGEGGGSSGSVASGGEGGASGPGDGGAIGTTAFVPPDPAETANYAWQACGVLETAPPATRAEYLTDGRLAIWRADALHIGTETEHPQTTIEGVSGTSALSEDGSLLAVVLADEIALRSVADDETQATWSLADCPATQLRISQGRVVSHGSSGACVFAVDEPQPVLRLDTAEVPLIDARLRNDELVSVQLQSSDVIVVTRRTLADEIVNTWQVDEVQAGPTALSPDATRIALVRSDALSGAALMVVDALDGSIDWISDENYRSGINSLKFSANGDFLSDGTNVYDAVDGAELWGPPNAAWYLQTIAPDGERIVTLNDGIVGWMDGCRYSLPAHHRTASNANYLQRHSGARDSQGW